MAEAKEWVTAEVEEGMEEMVVEWAVKGVMADVAAARVGVVRLGVRVAIEEVRVTLAEMLGVVG